MELGAPVTVHVAIGNSDNRLTQEEWSNYVHEVDLLVHSSAPHVHGTWFSPTDSPFQNACWSFEVLGDSHLWSRLAVQRVLREIAGRYRQDSIAWNESETVFLPGIPEG